MSEENVELGVGGCWKSISARRRLEVPLCLTYPGQVSSRNTAFLTRDRCAKS